MDRVNGWLFTAVIPLVLGIAAVLSGSPVLYILLFLSHFLLLWLVPLFKGRENLWMFVTVALSSVPVNVNLLISLAGFGGVFLPSFFPFALLRAVLIFCVLFGVEEIIMGILARLIWARQKKAFLDECYRSE